MERDEYTNDELMLAVGSGHKLYVQDWGNKLAKNVIISLHGGPGDGTNDRHKLSFSPWRDRVIFFDQRGAGKSAPHGSLKNNTTQDLIEDISKIADKLEVEKFILQGYSWGSTLALAYALEYPERVSALVIGGIFDGSKRQASWTDDGEFSRFYPEVWQTYLERTPKEHRQNPSKYHFDKVLNGAAEEQKKSAYAYDCLEGGIFKLDDRFSPQPFADFDPAGIKTEMYYLSNGCFLPDGYILKNAHKLTMPVYIVQGRYDIVCPPETAYRLHKELPNSELYWVISGHRVEHETQNLFSLIFARLNG